MARYAQIVSVERKCEYSGLGSFTLHFMEKVSLNGEAMKERSCQSEILYQELI